MKHFWISLVFLAACGPGPGAPQGSVTVYAASSLTESVEKIAREWTRRTGQNVRPQFEASSTLARQILEGAPADLFLSAAPEWIDRVHPQNRFDWVGNRLVVVVRKDVKEFHLESVGSLALANEQVPAGKYAQAALAYLHVKLPARMVYGANVRDVLSKVTQGGAMAGVVYATDASIDPGVRIAFTFPPESHPPILYVAGLLTPKGKALFDALREPWVLEVMRGDGFVDIK